jgi:hypothetical protein
MKHIPLTQGKYAKVDDEDYDWLMKHNWCINTNGYATRNEYGQTVFMHREIIKPPPGKITHHVNGDKLDDRKDNLQIVDYSRNGLVRHKLNRNNTSGYRGVTFVYGKWKAQIRINRKLIIIGWFLTPEDAHKAYQNYYQNYHKNS